MDKDQWQMASILGSTLFNVLICDTDGVHPQQAHI